MIRRLNQLVTEMNHAINCSTSKCGLLAFVAFLALALFSNNPCVWSQTAQTNQVAESADGQVPVDTPNEFVRLDREDPQLSDDNLSDQEAALSVDENQQVALDTKILGIPLWDDDLYKMVVRFLFNLFFLSLVVGIAYASSNRGNQRHIFNFVILNIVVFFICFTLKKMELELGMALGLFAIFAIIRYRTSQIDVKDMTYLFVVIGLAVINALSNKKTSYVELVFTNSTVFGACFLMEKFLGPEVKKVKLTRSELVYEKLDLLRPENVEELYDDIYQRTGIRADRVEIKQIDFQNGTSLIDVRQSRERAFGHQEDVAAGYIKPNPNKAN